MVSIENGYLLAFFNKYLKNLEQPLLKENQKLDESHTFAKCKGTCN
ncbi:MAG: hypothetical protein HQK53_17050 [Oligoflexia bacterium]|nr:hypothetical protein [Oligoflexia bacterium]